MRLLVIATDSAALSSPDPHTWVLRLAGVPSSAETPPPDCLSLADRAAARVRAAFPQWLWSWVKDHQALTLQTWPGPISWWWYCPLSEMSPLRTSLIREIYWLTLLDEVLQRHPVESVSWQGDDPLIARAAEDLVRTRRLSFSAAPSTEPWRRRTTYALCRRMWYFVSQLGIWLMLRIFRPGFFLLRMPVKAALYTRYPILWDRSHERMYGTWPEYLSQKKELTLFAAVWSEGWLSLLAAVGKIGRACREKQLIFLESFVSLKEFLDCHLTFGFYWRYGQWRSRLRRDSVLYDGFSITELWWRQLDTDILSTEIPFDRMISSGWRSLSRRLPSLETVYFPFEFQPMERAVWSGVRLTRDVKSVGIQTGLYGLNQMGFSFLPETVRKNPSDSTLAPLPDILAAYGEQAHKLFSERLGESRICLSGPIRYSVPQKNAESDSFRRAHPLTADKKLIFLALPAIRQEAIPILEGGLRLLNESPSTFVLIKFHYHLLLHDMLREMGRRLHVENRYKVFDTDIYPLMSVSTLMLTGGSSAGVEAMAMNCMPVVYRPLGEMPCNPMMDVPEGAFFWSAFEELRQAVNACLTQSSEYARRRDYWPRAVAAQMSPFDGLSNERLYQFLQRGKPSGDFAG